MDTNELLELLLADRVLDLAMRIRMSKTPKELSAEEAANWKAEHPAETFIPEALARIKGAATIMQSPP